MTYQDFYIKYIGKRVLYPPVATYECVSLVKKYLLESFGIVPGSWGDAKNYWLNTNPALLSRFDKLQTTPQQGDIVILAPTAGNPYGHIAIAHNTTHMLEQNGSTGGGTGTGNDAIRLRAIPMARLYGVLRPKVREQNEMIKTIEAADKLYKLLRPNSTATAGELQATAGKRSYEEFVNSAQAEVQNRDQELQNKDALIARLRNEISIDRQTILSLTDELNRTNRAALELKNRVDNVQKLDPIIMPIDPEVFPAPPKPTLLHKLILAVINLRKKT